MGPLIALTLFLGATVFPLFALPYLLNTLLTVLGGTIQSRTSARRDLLFSRAASEEAALPPATGITTSEDGDWEKLESSGILPSSENGKTEGKQWEGVIGFFHPFCNAGGGGERVLWAAIRATQARYPRALCVVYTGDHEVDKHNMLVNVENRFNIRLHAPRVVFLYLSTRHYVLASTWPHFTLLGQSLGSIVLAWDAFNLMAPDVFIDTMGYAFALKTCKWLFPAVPTGAYVHYPTISTDMLGSLKDTTGEKGVNAGLGKGWKGQAKKTYWELFAWLYSWAGGSVDVVMTNSSWTQDHILSLWDPARRRNGKKSPIEVVFPPVAVEELEEEIQVDEDSERTRKRNLLYISQFRPEKNHQLIITSFAEFMKKRQKPAIPGDDPRLVLVGSVRDDTDKMLVYKLRVLAREAGVVDHVDFVVNAKWGQILDHLRSSSVGVNGMWNEHFGIGVVEYQAAGLISVVNDSGGPKADIVVDVEGKPTGFHASTASEFAAGFDEALALSGTEALAMRRRARRNAKRFTDAEFRKKWIRQLDKLVRPA
ncbi:GDP-Man:Man(3)GlcNAc(2)-PP-Dol alpha-1,2-mannosyltransferase [Sphaceloma murrayae]|uniref:GDP-Man:Man(3)GlcNAc(2)-PP-Dol alpha-1,2-mannosyltransferase n=1 Tax=Sphaceloma murrayae TaxID=2082308 RepID=A0A2K1QHE1_9PEZI|nr:GDP-Man:Man(3)GlcNAc(2)-PP-Dol alpha-1,2-mannosyltransferase [Sphaceloma murrayae]